MMQYFITKRKALDKRLLLCYNIRVQNNKPPIGFSECLPTFGFFMPKKHEKSVKKRKKYAKSSVFSRFLYSYYTIFFSFCQVLFENKIRERMFFLVFAAQKSLNCF